MQAQKDSLNIYEILMSALVAGSKAGGDKRCGEQKAQSVFIVMAKPEDDEKNPYMKLVVTGQEKGGKNAVTVLLEEYRKWIRRKVISK